MKRGLAISNPAAGGGSGKKRARKVLDALARGGKAPELVETTHAGHAIELAAEAARANVGTVIAIGGDGTTFEVANGLLREAATRERGGNTGDPIRIGVIPVGTGNSFVRDFGLTTTELAVEAVLRGHTRPADAVRVVHAQGTSYYVNLLSIGFTAEVGALTNRRFKALGATGYAVSVLVEVSRLKPQTFTYGLDGAETFDREGIFVSFSNTRCTGGSMQMAPKADVSDGAIDVIHVGDLGRGRLLSAFPRIYKGTHLALEDVSHTIARNVVFGARRPQAVMVDGEVVEWELHELNVMRHALQVVA